MTDNNFERARSIAMTWLAGNYSDKGHAVGLEEISKAIEKSPETIVEMSLSKPSLEDVFLTMTGTKLREGKVIERP